MTSKSTDGSIALSATGISKNYRIWTSPSARLYGPLANRVRRIAGKTPTPERYYRDFSALNEMSLSIGAGECLGVIGKNGSGKSTLLQILAGTLQSSSGSVSRPGKVAALLELGTGFNHEFTGRENVFLYGAINGLSSDAVAAVFDSVVEFSGLGDFIEQPLRTYSSGMVVRLAFSLLTHLDPDVLIIDEALAVGDAAFVQKCMRWLRGFIKEKTVILVSHDLGAITSLCSRAIWLKQGEVVFDGHPKRATELYLESIYEDQPTGSAETSNEQTPEDSDVSGKKDFRHETLKDPEHRNELKFFKFDPEAESFGKRKATINQVELLDELGQPVSMTAGGEVVRIKVHVHADEAVSAPIIGFGVKNRLGQELFHDNTYLSSHSKDDEPLEIEEGGRFVAEFVFRMPYFNAGEYFIFAAVATGTHDDHSQQHWVHEALKFSSNPNRICLGLIGLPMMEVSLKQEDS
ncbi:ABC transporter ATP-binding protein [Rubellicoccus peritrichatus]|uniref:ABC transporter ATP-binding protein n=1 Tax=Rubellicoccus peritrichatus TaxID=3080537 RepID=A0AAQ3QS06_9BACT|nr:ABC transporter ATP-binding protein [Puniceicoccus sp. CR14]WOO39841.1 ABC transporter ATP-binding protein [Puniceicoccus sp. CR14]